MRNVIAIIFAVMPFAVLDAFIFKVARLISTSFTSGALASVAAIAANVAICYALFKTEVE